MDNEHIIAIYNRDKNIALTEFDKFMHKTNDYMNELAVKEKRYKDCDGRKLDLEVIDAMKINCEGTPFRETDIDLVSGQRFPDIVAGRHFGVEVKSTRGEKWESTGSSIIESTRVKDVDYIYMLFGKLGGTPVEFRCKPYQECLCDITVTHSPRYLINMNITPEETIFAKMGTDYESFRLSEKSVEITRKYYLDKAEQEGKLETPWWLSQEVVAPPTLKLWVDGAFEKEQQELYRALLLMLFPVEIFRSEYKNSVLWLCVRLGILKSNFRDLFTAGGQVVINGVRCSKIIQWILKLAPLVKQSLENKEWMQDLKDYNEELLNVSEPFNAWAEQVAGQYPQIKKLKEWIMATV